MSTLADSVIDRLASSLMGLTREQREQNDAFKEMYSNRKVLGVGDTEADIRKRLRMRDRELKRAEEGAKAAAKYNLALENVADAMKNNPEATKEMTRAAARAARSLIRNANKMDDATQDKLHNDAILLESGKVIDDKLGELTETAEKLGRGQTELYNTTAILKDQQDRAAKTLLRYQAAAAAGIKRFFSLTSAVGLAAFGTKKLFGQLEYSLKHQVPLMDLAGSNFTDTAAKYGVSVDTLMQVQNEYAGALLASSRGIGGMRGAATQLLVEFDAMRTKLHQVTGDYDDALKLAGTMRDTLSFSGVRYGTEQFVSVMNQPGGMIDSMRTLATVTNKSVEEIAAMNRQIMMDRDMRFTMLGLDERQRRNRLQDMMQHQTFLVAKGMEIEQAMESAAAFEKLNVQVSPKERYKQAARIRAIAGALGVQGGEQFMSIAMKPTGQRTPEDKERMAQFATDFESAMGKKYGGDTASQMSGGAYMQTVAGPLYDTLIKGMSTAGLEAREIDEGTMEQIRLQKTQLAGQQETGLRVKRLVERLTAFSSDAGIYLAGGALAGIGAMLWQLNLSSKYLAAIAASSALGGLGGTAARGAGVAAAGMRSAGVGMAAGFVGGFVLDKAAEALGKDTQDGILMSIAAHASRGAGIGALGGPKGIAAGAILGGLYGVAQEGIGKWGDARSSGSNKTKIHDSLKLAEQNKNTVEQNKELRELVAIMRDQTKTTKEQVEAAKNLTTALSTNSHVTNQNTQRQPHGQMSRRGRNRGPVNSDEPK